MNGSPTEPSVGIVLLNWNTYSETKACLSSLKEVSYKNADVVVVDNNSQDDSADKLESEFEWITLIRNDTNRGFAGGCNVGIEYFKHRDYKYVLLLNNDTVVEPGFIEPLVQTAEAHQCVAGVSSVIEYKDDEGIWFAGGEFDPILVRWHRETEIKSGRTYETGFITGAVFLMPIPAIEELGTLNESFFFGGEDQDFVYRAHQNGWRFFIAPDSVVLHEVGAASETGSPFKYYHATRNRILFSSLHHSSLEKVQFTMYFIVSRIIRIIQWLYFWEIDRTRAVAIGISDAICDNEIRKPSEF